MSVPHDDLMSSLVRELGEDPPLPPELEAEIWTGTQRKIAAGVVIAASAAVAVAAARAAATPAAGSLTFSSIISSAAGKVAVAVALTVGGVSGYVVRALAPEPAPSAISAISAISTPPSSPAVAVEQPVVDEPLPPPARPERRRLKQQAPPVTEVTKRELVLMDRARAALARESAADALAAVREQRALPAPRGFDEESEAIEVFALGRLDPARAAASARAFLQKHPDSPLVARVRSFADPISDHGSAP